MRIDYLAPRPAGTAFLAGDVGRGGVLHRLGAVVVRTSFDLQGSNPRTRVPSADADRQQVMMADEQFQVPQNPDITDFYAEGDIALEKQIADVVVRGRLRNPSTSALLQVNGITWLSRGALPEDANEGTEGDTTVNVFGYHARGEDDRTAADPYVLPGSYQIGFNNFYRRSASFNDAGMVHNVLPAGALVEVSETNGASTTTYSLALPDPLRLRARYFTYCGHGIDKLPYWNPSAPFDLAPDTLIVNTTNHTAAIVWRGSWDFADHAPDLYRSIQVVEEGGF
jgi:hypothetical protein